MVYNGKRLTEGKGEDWYEDIAGRIVIRYTANIQGLDKVFFEYPDFSEEELDNKELYVECACGVIISSARTICGPCQVRGLLSEIDGAHFGIDKLQKAILQKELEKTTVLREWEEYLKEEDKLATSRRRDSKS